MIPRSGFILVAVLGVAALVLGAGNARGDDHRRGGHCSLRTIEGLYGFHCNGFLPPVSPGATEVQPASFVGYLRNDAHGHVEGNLTLNTALGSLPSRVSGTATLDPDRECIGTVVYDKNQIEVAPGVWVDGPPLTADFAIVHDGDEVLGAPTAFPGQTGALVPRATCRIVRAGRD